MYIFLFITLYFQILLLVSFFEKQEEKGGGAIGRKISYLSTTIIVPCYNEESTVQKTIDSLLQLHYPIDQYTILVIDDGSTDGTWSVLQQYAGHKNITLLQKENEGSKYAALNFALQHVDSELVGVLDADSWVDPDALVHYMPILGDSEVMAVIPSMVVANPDSFFRKAQKAEYDMGLFARKALYNMNSLYITPGPFSVFRKDVFDSLGPYQEAHHTEDAEIALRLQKHGHKIAYSEKSIVYTVGPKTIRPLIKQRIRWVYGFLRNVFDYRDLLFKKEYGPLGMVVLPMGVFRVFISVILFPLSLWLIILPIFRFFQKIVLVGFDSSLLFSFDWFFVSTDSITLITAIGFILSMVTLWLGRDLIEEPYKITVHVLHMLCMYTFIAPIWLITSSYNALFSRKGTWR